MAAWAGNADILRASSVKTAIKNTGIKCVSKLLYTGRHFGTESAVRKRGGSRNLPYLNAKPRQIPLLGTYA